MIGVSFLKTHQEQNKNLKKDNIFLISLRAEAPQENFSTNES